MAKILIDTHIFLWALAEPNKLSDNHKQELVGLHNTIYVSSVTVAELMIKSSIGKLTINFDPVSMIDEIGFEQLSFSGKDALHLKDMPFHHRDPFDRMLIAQSLENKLKILTEDTKFKSYDCDIL